MTPSELEALKSEYLLLDKFCSLAIQCPQLLQEFDRLNGTNLSMKGTGVDLLIDKSSGRQEEDMRKFVDFCKDMVSRLLPELTLYEMMHNPLPTCPAHPKTGVVVHRKEGGHTYTYLCQECRQNLGQAPRQ